jgi:ubiquitin C-terminal hydrolase
MSEDLYRGGKKPYVDMSDKPGQSDKEASADSWNKYIIRNNSIITDLFVGQYKSTLICNVCEKVSVTFDAFLTISLPIPGKKE